MFVTRKKLDSLLDGQYRSLNFDINQLKDKYYLLMRKHDILLSHLGLTEIEVPSRLELRKKGGPEKET